MGSFKMKFIPIASTLASVQLVLAQDERPTEFQACSIAKQLIEVETEASMITRLYEDRLPEEYESFPYGQVELIASDCTQEIGSEKSGSLLVFSSPMTGTLDSLLNHENNVTFDVRDTLSPRPIKNSMMRHRASFMGYLEFDLPTKPGVRENITNPEYDAIAKCYFSKNPIAKSWEVVPIPGHGFHFYRFIPTQIRYIGGFGGAHYIGWLDVKKYQKAPNTAYCKDWGNTCAAYATTNTTRCCPVNYDNEMHECCQALEKELGFDDETTTTVSESTATTTTKTTTKVPETSSSVKILVQFSAVLLALSIL